MRGTRQRFVAAASGALAGLCIPRYPAGAAEFSYKCSTDNAADHPVAVRAAEAATKIMQTSGGRLEVSVFPSSQLGGQLTILSQVRLGAVQMAINYDAVTETVVPAAGLSAIPFAFTTHQAAWKAMDGPFGKYMRAQIAKVGLYTTDKAWDAGFRELENSLRPIHSPSDIRGLKIRIPDSQISTNFFKALGAVPASVNNTEMYGALQTHLVDGLEVPLIGIWVRKTYEVLKYVSYAHQMWSSYQLIVNGDAWKALPPNLRDTFEQNFDVAAVQTRDDALRDDAVLENRLKAQGMSFNQVDIPAFRAVLTSSGFYTQCRDHYGAESWAQLENAVGTLR